MFSLEKTKDAVEVAQLAADDVVACEDAAVLLGGGVYVDMSVPHVAELRESIAERFQRHTVYLLCQGVLAYLLLYVFKQDAGLCQNNAAGVGEGV